MVNRIDLPQQPQGSAEEQMRAMYSYLYQMAQALNNNLEEIGGAELTDSERVAMQEVLSAGAEAQAGAATEAETLKSLIIKTASFIKTAIDQYNLKLTGSTEAEGKIGKYVRNTQLDVDVTPTGIQQSFSFQEIIQGLKTYEINAKNYIKSGLLRTVNGVPVYGVAIGKDIVTFSQDGTETYNDGNKVAELTAEELSFWQNGAKVASYKGNGINFAQDVTIASGKKLIIDTENFKINSAGKVTVKGDGEFSGELKAASGTFAGNLQAAGGTFSGELKAASGDFTKLESGNWSFDENGMYFNEFTGGYEFEFSLGKTSYNNTADSCGIMHHYWRYTLYRNAEIILFAYDKAARKYGTVNILFRLSDSNPNISISASERMWITANKLNPANYGDETIGESNNKWKTAWIETINYQQMVQNSSKDIKHDIRDMPSMGARLDRLRPVTFIYDEDREERTRYGLIYEEAVETMPEICTGSEENKAINYLELIPMLLKEIQELRGRVNELERRLDNVQSD